MPLRDYTVNPSLESAVLQLGTDVNAARAFSIEEFAGGRVFVDAVATATKIVIHDSYRENGTFYAAQDRDGAALEIAAPAAGESYPLPDEIHGAGAIKLVVDAGTADVRVGFKT